jgi:ubiquinone/menaquinone biosynthesis C-methylase UbiE
MQNPWLKIPAEDYEKHMSAPHVAQLQFLNDLFRQLLFEHKPEKILFAGCTTGNGFEHIDFKFTNRVVGIDINEEYLKIARERFSDKRIEFINNDVCMHNFGNQKFDLVHCALIFEYVDVQQCLNNLVKFLKDDGVLSVLLQLPSESHSIVSKTDYKSLESLGSIVKLVDVDLFKNLITQIGLKENSNRIITLESGKCFYHGMYERIKSH